MFRYSVIVIDASTFSLFLIVLLYDSVKFIAHQFSGSHTPKLSFSASPMVTLLGKVEKCVLFEPCVLREICHGLISIVARKQRYAAEFVLYVDGFTLPAVSAAFDDVSACELSDTVLSASEVADELPSTTAVTLCSLLSPAART